MRRRYWHMRSVIRVLSIAMCVISAAVWAGYGTGWLRPWRLGTADDRVLIESRAAAPPAVFGPARDSPARWQRNAWQDQLDATYRLGTYELGGLAFGRIGINAITAHPDGRNRVA